MKFGLQLTNLEWPKLRDLCQTAEDLGYGLITFPDHVVLEGLEGDYDPKSVLYDAITSAAVAAEATKTIRVGHLVLCNLFRHPVFTAQSLASLDQLSAGRMIAGLGSGWTEREFRMTGIPFRDAKTRLAMLDEALTCIRSLWTQDETSFEGEHYQFDRAVLWPKPKQDPHPPVLVGGSGKGLLRIAAKHADYVNIIAEVGRAGMMKIGNLSKLTDEAYRSKVEFLRSEAKNAGRDPDAIRVSNIIFNVQITETESQADESAKAVAQMMGSTPEAIRQSPLMLFGTPEQCVKELQRRQTEWGVSQFVFSTSNEKLIRRLAEEVLKEV